MGHVTEGATIRAGILTVSDGVARGERVDRSGDLAAQRLPILPASVTWRRVVSDDPPAIHAAVVAAAEETDLLVVTGGTGLGPRDVTPQTVRPLLDYEAPGLAEAMRAHGLTRTPHAMLSREVTGVRGRCLVLALPGSPGAVDDCLDAVWAALPHALALLRGETAHHAPAHGSAA
jgi:molybdenum cofactor synthesis domain-containing protein